MVKNKGKKIWNKRFKGYTIDIFVNKEYAGTSHEHSKRKDAIKRFKQTVGTDARYKGKKVTARFARI